MTFNVKCAPVIKEWNFCCCSCSLRSASITLAWIILVGCVVQFVSYIVYLAELEHLDYERKSILTTSITVLVGSMILDALLLYGIHKKKPAFMLPYLVMDLIGIVLGTLAVLVITVFILMYNWMIALMIFVVGCCALALSVFFWVVLYSYYRQMEEEMSYATSYTTRIPCAEDPSPPAYDDAKALYGFPKTGEPELA